MPSPIDYKEFAKVQLSDEEFQLLKSCTNSLKVQFLKVRQQTVSIDRQTCISACRDPAFSSEIFHLIALQDCVGEPCGAAVKASDREVNL
ncbi:hypothetical protein AVEN_30675-1 [Araneus ventricosus]|uniref:Uncharacterized protein n=1 Tax=Araneus ventricosus TaxID=182803 RepID=A0A4Y2IW75_ARAVE|nr:hypothetical protein AVEN_30675-1 [Araneus ventricosus]